MASSVIKIKKIFISAGEQSGDLHGALLTKSLIKKNQNLQIIGIGSENMEREGVNLLFNSFNWGVVGATEILWIIPKLLSVLRSLDKIIDIECPDLAILIDYPGFNLNLAKLFKRKGIPIVYYIPPIVLWRKGKKAKKVSSLANKIITIFPQEAEIYKKFSKSVDFIGHPLIDIVKVNSSREEIFKKFGIDERKRIIGILPGSREQEISNLLPVMRDATDVISQSLSDIEFLLPIASDFLLPKVVNILGVGNDKIKIVKNLTYEVMSVSDLIVTSSGTATLEATILGVPMIIVYKVSKITELLANFVLTKKIIGLPNMISQKIVVPELLQENCNPKSVANFCLEHLQDNNKREKIKIELKQIKNSLGNSGVADRVADIILKA